MDFIYRAYFRFGSSGVLEALPTALGWSTRFEISDATIEVVMPTLEDRLTLPGEQIPEYGARRLSWREEAEEVVDVLLVGIDYFTVTIEFATEASQAALEGDSGAPDFEALRKKIDEIDVLALDVASRIRRWLFVSQPDLGPSEELPPRIYAEPIRVKATGARLAIAPSITLYGSASETGIDLPELEALGAALREQAEPQPPDVLLAQARAALIHQRGKVVQPELSVLLAAVAAEVKAKRTWESIVSEEGRPLLDLTLKNPRAFPQSAIELFDSVAEAVAGKSLRVEDGETFRKIRRLFELRNRVAHDAAPIDEGEARASVNAVPRAFGWLETIQIDQGPSREAQIDPDQPG